MMTDAITNQRLTMCHNGFRVLPVTNPDQLDRDGRPVPHAGKNPHITKWDSLFADADADAVAAFARKYPEHTNTGIMCGDIVGVDIDVPIVELASAVKALAFKLLGSTSLERIGHAPKLLLVFRTVKPFKKMSTAALKMPDGTAVKCEVLGRGQQFVADGIHPKTRAPFEWPGDSPLTVPYVALPETTEEDCRKFITEAEIMLRAAGAKSDKDVLPKAVAHSPAKRTSKASGQGRRQNYVDTAIDEEVEGVRKTTDGNRNDALNRALFSVGGFAKTGWAPRSYLEGQFSQAMIDNGYAASDGERAIAATLKSGLDDAPPREPPEHDETAPRRARANGNDNDEDGVVTEEDDNALEAAENSELFLSDALVRQFNGRLRYVSKWGAFKVWDGAVWRQDDKREVHTAARALAARASHRLVAADKLAQAKTIAMRKTVAGIVGLTEVHADVTASETQWDVNDWIINTPGGVVDLRNGVLREGDPLEYCTKITAVAPSPSVPSDCLWLRVLDRVCAPGVAGYLKRFAGYSLTGSTREESAHMPARRATRDLSARSCHRSSLCPLTPAHCLATR
jgi:hypothetical protein